MTQVYLCDHLKNLCFVYNFSVEEYLYMYHLSYLYLYVCLYMCVSHKWLPVIFGQFKTYRI